MFVPLKSSLSRLLTLELDSDWELNVARIQIIRFVTFPPTCYFFFFWGGGEACFRKNESQKLDLYLSIVTVRKVEEIINHGKDLHWLKCMVLCVLVQSVQNSGALSLFHVCSNRKAGL